VKTIQILTPQNVLIEHELASVVMRGLAFFIDQIAITLFLVFMYVFFEFLGITSLLQDLFVYIVVIPVYFLYTLLFEALNYGQTLGKMMVGVKVRRLDGNEVTFTEAATRWLMRVPDIFISAGALAAILVSSTERSQRMGDILAGTIVIRQVTNNNVSVDNLMKINTVENYQPRYPEVLNLDEKDVVLIKQTLIRFSKYGNVAHYEAIDALVKKLKTILRIEKVEQSKVEFLRTLIKDYIVLTR
jgi:uncharacterized RDD family membrane protein YckC